jgi:hypothetical protein
VGKYCKGGQATDDNMAGMRIAWWITKATNTLRIWNTYCFFHGKNCYANAPQYYVIRTFLTLLLDVQNIFS